MSQLWMTNEHVLPVIVRLVRKTGMDKASFIEGAGLESCSAPQKMSTRQGETVP